MNIKNENLVTIAKKALLVIDEVRDAYKDDERMSAEQFKNICSDCAWKFSELRRPFSGEENGVECAVDLALEMCRMACRDIHVGDISDNSGIAYLETMECIFAGVLDAQGGGDSSDGGRRRFLSTDRSVKECQRMSLNVKECH